MLQQVHSMGMLTVTLMAKHYSLPKVKLKLMDSDLGLLMVKPIVRLTVKYFRLPKEKLMAKHLRLVIHSETVKDLLIQMAIEMLMDLWMVMLMAMPMEKQMDLLTQKATMMDLMKHL